MDCGRIPTQFMSSDSSCHFHCRLCGHRFIIVESARSQFQVVPAVFCRVSGNSCSGCGFFFLLFECLFYRIWYIRECIINSIIQYNTKCISILRYSNSRRFHQIKKSFCCNLISTCFHNRLKICVIMYQRKHFQDFLT